MFYKSIVLVLLAMLSAYSTAETLNYTRTLVVADSIGAASVSWPQQLGQLYPEVNVHNNAQGGRRSRDVDIVRDYRCGGFASDQRKCVVLLSLGSNDTGENNLRIAMETRRLIDQTKIIGGKPVVLLPPVHPRWTNEMQRVRKFMERAAGQRNVPTIDLNVPWRAEETTDGVHPNSILSREIAEYVYHELVALGLR